MNNIVYPLTYTCPNHSLGLNDNHQRPHLHLVNGLFQYLATLIITKNQKLNRLPPPPLLDLSTVSLSTFVV